MNRSSDEIYDEWLVTRCQRNDVAAWDELVQRWNNRLWYYVRGLIEDEQDATNALQDAWLHAIRGIRSLKSTSRLAPWLYTIARRTAMTHFRREYARREYARREYARREANEIASIEDEADDVGDTQLQLENAELVHFGLNRLSLPEREVLTLFFLEDLTTKEIAELLGIPAGTVKSRLFKARRELRRVLERESQRHES